MKVVKIYQMERGRPKLMATTKLVGDKVVCEGDPGVVYGLNEGIQNVPGQHPLVLYPKDGLLFLERVSTFYNDAYYQATSVIEEDSI